MVDIAALVVMMAILGAFVTLAPLRESARGKFTGVAETGAPAAGSLQAVLYSDTGETTASVGDFTLRSAEGTLQLLGSGGAVLGEKSVSLGVHNIQVSPDGRITGTASDTAQFTGGSCLQGPQNLQGLIADTKLKQTDPKKYKEWLEELKDAVRKRGAWKQERSDTPSTPDDESRDCDDYASEVETSLQGSGFNATFTVLHCFIAAGAASSWSEHALADAHAPDGSVIWFEPGLSPDDPGFFQDMDLNGDGAVSVATTHGDGTEFTEESQDGTLKCRIEVFASRADAENSGETLDKK